MQTYNLFWRSVKWRFQNPVTIIMTLVQPLIWLLLFSTIFSGGKAEENYTAFILPGILVMGVLSSSGVSGIANYSLKTGGSFYRIMISPVRRSSVILAHILDAAVLSFIQIAILMGIAFLMSVRIALGISGMLSMAVLLFLSVAFVAAVSYAISLTLPDENSFIALINTFTLPLFFVSSALIPFEQLHGGFRIAAMINPFTHVVNSLRMLVQGTMIDWFQFFSVVGLLLVLGAISFIAAVYSLKKDSY
ncbi:ABC transporter permease [Lacrimispora sphenoides]|uniref:Transport permease protein n=1 Tax=Lacrimispora sphenoides JCM 1415 TaxID=1297793 RepID=A0ABY1CC49_9FIRM|nr:ABC transporter permease [Lacrimispora sphenoides]SET91453.1 ABC-2 type transport system permease protein [[Clostridium] sphenoides JCM 1415]SUY52312.1 ABC transporter permease [Lacrimispora sphenoides]